MSRFLADSTILSDEHLTFNFNVSDMLKEPELIKKI